MAEEQSNQPGGSNPEAAATLQQRIALEMKKRREAKGPSSSATAMAAPATVAEAGQAAPAPAIATAAPAVRTEATVSLQDLIARKRQKLEAELARRQAEEAKAQAEAPAAAPAAAATAVAEVAAPAAGEADKVAAQVAQAPAAETAATTPSPAVAAPAAKTASAMPVTAAAKYLNMSGGTVSLQEVISRKKAETVQALTAAAAPAAAPAAAAPATVAAVAVAPAEAPGRRTMVVAAMIILNTLLLAVVGGLLAFLLTHGRQAPSGAELALALMARPAAEPKTKPAEPNATNFLAEVEAPVAAMALSDLPSWAQAENAFALRDHKTALDRYGRLMLGSRSMPGEATSGEFFLFRVAECVWSLGRPEAAQKLLKKLTSAESPAVRGAAHAALAEMAEAEGELLAARTLAYRGTAALAVLETPLPLEADCEYIAARALTRKVNALYDSRQAVPWARLQRSDPFAGLAEPAARRLLEEGAAAGRSARAGVGGIKIEQVGQRWRLSAAKATVEDVLNQFAAAAGMNVQWASADAAARRRTVDVQIREMASQRVVEVVAGTAGLVARFAPERVTVHDAGSAGSLQDQQTVLGGEAESVWRRFALRYGGDARLGEGSFALAALHEWMGDKVSALRQYQFVAKQYTSQPRISPEALLRSATIRTDLRDYAGAEQDLLELLDVFPQYPRSADVYAKLGRLKSLVGKPAEALTLLSRVLTFDVTPDVRRETMLAASDCCFAKGDYDAACHWMSELLGQKGELSQEAVVEACGRLGQFEAARGNHNAAIGAYRRALQSSPSRSKYVELVLGVARSHQAAGDPVGSLRVLGRLNGQDMSPDRLADWLMQLSSAYRAMNLPDRARLAIRKHGGAVTDTALQSRLVLEQARCLAEEGELAAARQAMTEALAKMGGSEEARAASLDLAELCLKMSDAGQAIILAEDTLRAKCSDEQRRRALELMGRAHLARNEYEKAVRALSAMAEVKMAAAAETKGGHK